MAYNANRNPDGITFDIFLGPTASAPNTGAAVVLEGETLTFDGEDAPPAPGKLMDGETQVCLVGVVKTGNRLRNNT